MNSSNNGKRFFVIQERDRYLVGLAYWGILFLFVLLTTPLLIDDRPSFVWFVYLFLAVSLIIDICLIVHSIKKPTKVLELNKDGLMILEDNKETRFRWNEIESINLRLITPSNPRYKYAAFLFVKPFGKTEIGIPIFYYIFSFSKTEQNIKRVVYEYTGSSDLVKNDIPPFWKRFFLPWRVAKLYKTKQK